MLTIEGEAIIKADPAAVWRAWKPPYPLRPREEESRNRDLYDLGGGFKVPVVLTAMNEMSNWTVEHALPRGRLVIDHRMSALGNDQVRVSKRFEVHGPMSVVYRLFLAGRIRRAIPADLDRLRRT